MKVARIVGARPQFMQVPVVRDALFAAGHTHSLIHTGQHYDAAMSDAFFCDLQLPSPDVSLDVGSGLHGAVTGKMMEKIEAVLLQDRPDIVLVDGDTNSTLAAALAAVKLHIPVAHIEAGLRDHDWRRPEEINRIMTDHAASLNAAPVQRALANLQAEGLGKNSLFAGDVLLDCFLRFLGRADHAIWRGLGLQEERFHLLTLHRPENTDLHEMGRFRQIMDFLADLAEPVVFPVHPRTQAILAAYESTVGALPANLLRTEPASYLQMLGLVCACDCVFTDSGGVPREAAWAGKRCVMLHRIDVWHDLLAHGWVEIGKTDRDSIATAYTKTKKPDSQAVRDFFGGGRASTTIAEAISKHLG
jgi:UDP-N-acetylglucosamine 2-epimerase